MLTKPGEETVSGVFRAGHSSTHIEEVKEMANDTITGTQSKSILKSTHVKKKEAKNQSLNS